MKAAKPPAFALWLLKHAVDEEALAGDLLEQFSQGRTGAWFWRQVLVAIRWHKFVRLLGGPLLFGWMFTLPGVWDKKIGISRPLDMAIIAVLYCAALYLPEMLRGRQRAAVAVAIAVSHLLLYRYQPDLAYHYQGSSFLLVISLVLFRNKTYLPGSKGRLRELLKMGTDTEKERMIAHLHITMLQEADPCLRQAYSEAIAALRGDEPLAAKAAGHEDAAKGPVY